MLDTLYQWIVSFLTVALDLAISLWPKQFERLRYRITAGICGILLGIGTLAEMDRERRKSTREREAAIQETSVRVSASTSASVADVLGRQFADNVGEVRNLRQATVANTGRLNALWEDSQSGKQKRQDVRDWLNGYVGMSNSVFGQCHAVGPPNHGGTSAQVCLDDARQWTSSVAGYISGSLGDLYLNRFEPAGLPNNSEVAQLTGIDSNLDARIAAQV